MSRHISTIPVSEKADLYENAISGYLTQTGFKLKNKNGKVFWQLGTGMLALPLFLELDYKEGNEIELQAYMPAFTWWPGVFSGESDFTGI